jgi:hypothetical protein
MDLPLDLLTKIRFIIISSILFIGCVNQSNQEIQDDSRFSMNDTFNLPIDTLAILDSMNLQVSYKADGIDSITNLDTFELRYIAYACDCQHWVDVEMYEAYENQDEEIYGEDSIGYYGFNTDDYGYFLREGDNVLSIEDLSYTANSRIRFFGKVEDEPDYYTQSEIPQRKQVITYFGYEVILPLTVYGPYYDTEKYEIPSDTSATMIRRMSLTINE